MQTSGKGKNLLRDSACSADAGERLKYEYREALKCSQCGNVQPFRWCEWDKFRELALAAVCGKCGSKQLVRE